MNESRFSLLLKKIFGKIAKKCSARLPSICLQEFSKKKMEPSVTKIMWKLINHQYSVIRVRLIVSLSESSFSSLQSDSVTQNHSIMCALCILAHLFLYSKPHSSNGTICLMCLKCESNFCWSNMVWDWISIALTKYTLTQQVNDSHICLLGNCKNKSKKKEFETKKNWKRFTWNGESANEQLSARWWWMHFVYMDVSVQAVKIKCNRI